MSKIDLDPITSGYNLSKINANFQKVEDELNNKVLYRNSPTGEPNSMSSNLDMNGNKILNVVTGTSPSDLATRGYVDEEIAEERVYVDQQLYLVNSELDTKYDKTGGPVFGDINLNGHKLIGASEVQTSKTSTSILEINGVPVIPGNSVIDPYNGTREALRRSYAEAGYHLVNGSFEAGGTVTNASDVLLYEAEGKAYSYTGGTFQHTVVAGSNPSAEPGMWTPISAIYLRTIVSPLVIASFKKAGFNVVGSFEVGASTSDKNDAVIKYSTGKAYVRTDGLPFTVISGSTPSTGWTEVTDSVTLSSSVISRTDVSSQADSFFNKTYSPVKIVAHRGFSFIAMENTIWAFQKAKNLGADMLECDIQVSSDGIPLIFHDDTTDRLMSGTGDVLSMTYATMAAMTFTSLAGTAYKNEVIPRFVDMCYWLRSNDIQVLAEFKRLRSIADVQLIINIAKQYEVLDKFVWQCNDTTILVEARKYAPKNKIAFFSDTFIQSRLDELSLMGNAIYMVQYAALNADNTIGGKCHAAGVELATYTNNNSYTLRRLRRDGLQYIITDVNLGRLS